MKTQETKQLPTVIPIEIDPKLPENRRQEILNGFVPLYEQIQELEDEYAAITQADVTVFTPKLASRARKLRLSYVSIRGKNGLKGAHSELKEKIKTEGQVIDLLERKPREFLIQEREAKLEEIEKHEEREEARRIAELHEERIKILSEYDAAETDLNLGEMTEEKWEEHFGNARAIFQAKVEMEAKQALRDSRLRETSPYSLFIKDYNVIRLEDLTEKRYKEILEEGKSAFEKQEQAVQEAKEKAKRFSKRISLISGGELKEDGVYYNGKKIATLKSLEDSNDEKFNAFLNKHLLNYNADKEAERVRLEEESIAKRKQEEERIKIETERRVAEERRKRVEEESRREEEKLLQARREAEERKKSPYPNQLREYAKAWSELEIPVPNSNDFEAIPTYNTLKDMIQRGIAYVESQADKLEG